MQGFLKWLDIKEVVILERTAFANLHPKAVERLGAVPDRTLRKEEAADMYSMAYPILHQGNADGYKL